MNAKVVHGATTIRVDSPEQQVLSIRFGKPNLIARNDYSTSGDGVALAPSPARAVMLNHRSDRERE